MDALDAKTKATKKLTSFSVPRARASFSVP
jgi:hypothetical protein